MAKFRDSSVVHVWARLLIGTACLLAPGVGYALGLGKLTMHSALNEPIDAEIELYSVSSKERSLLQARVASRAEFKRANIERPAHLSLIKFSVKTRADGRSYLKLTSDVPIREPFLHFLVEVEWTGGRLVREYTALLDPPLYTKGRPRAVTSPTVAGAKSQPYPDSVPPAGVDLDEPEVSEQGRLTATGRAGAPPTQLGPTRRGDTLWNFAERLKPALGVSEYRIMLALLRENPTAFVGNNINRLKTGRILKLPARRRIASISKREAVKEYRVQLEAWEEYKLRLASATRPVGRGGPAAAAPSKKPASPKTPALGDAVPEAKPSAAQAAPSPEKTKAESPTAPASTDLLKIVQATLEAGQRPSDAQNVGTSDRPGAAVGGASDKAVSLNNKVATLEETLVSKELEAKELRTRVKLLEEQVKNATRLIELENQSLALTQKQAAKAQQNRKVDVKPRTTPVKPPVAAQGKPGSKPRVARKLARQRVDRSLFDTVRDTLFSGWVPLVGIAVAVVMFGVIGLYVVRIRRARAEFEESILDGSAIDSKPDTGDSGQAVSSSDTSFLSDFGVPGMGSMHADEVDPLAEAEVYLAYGRSEQAEEVLKEAIGRNPQRVELKLKLLEIYQQRNDVNAFETLAEEMYPAHEEDGGEIWARVVALGKKVNPNNPLFRTTAAGAPGEIQPPDATGMTPPITGEEEVKPFPAPQAEEGLELDLDDLMAEAADTPAPETGAGESIEFDVDTPDIKVEEAEAGGDIKGMDLGDAPQVTAQDTAMMEGIDLDLEAGEERAAGAAGSAETDTRGGGERPSPESAGATRNELADTWDPQVTADAPLEMEEEAVPREGEGEPIGPPSELDKEPEADSPLAGITEGELRLDSETGALSAVEDEARFELAGELGDGEPTGADKGDGNGADEQVEWDETATKLDLAKAYIDMGDEPGARSILDEVMIEGSEAQKKQAQELTSQLGGSPA